MPLQEITIEANNIDGAVEEIIGFLEHTRQWGVIYVDGWAGTALGASAILNAVVKQLRSPLSGTATRKAAGLDKIIHIDCSLWQNKRSLQKAIAKELRLPQEVMAFFDQADEEDDFDGVEQVARGVILHVKWAILNELSNCKFLVVFHNGSGNYVDLWECGVPVMGGVMSKRVLWASQGRFLLHHSRSQEDAISMEEFAGLSDVAIWVMPHIYINKNVVMNEKDLILPFLQAEADEVARYSGVPGPDSSKIVLECILYKVLRRNYNINWGIHAANYWVCDGIIEDDNDYGRSAWEIGDALHRNMNLDWSMSVMDDLYEFLSDKKWRHSEHWVSLTSQDEAAAEVPTSFFTFDNVILVGGMFEQSYMSKLRVLHLSHCIFSYSYPPFLGCSNLRFLLLDHCEDKKLEPHDGQNEGCSQDIRTCFQTLWVLELSYTNWHWLLLKEMLDLMVELRELNVKGADNRSMRYLHHCSGSKSSMVKLRVVVATESIEDDEVVESTRVLTRSSNNKDYGINGAADDRDQVSSFPDISSWHFLKSIILDGCGELEEIGYNALPPSLESFSFTNNIAATRIKSICLSRCAKLKSMLLTGRFGSLVELDMSGTLVKTLDLRAVKALRLRKIFLLGCENLYAILWPWKENKKIELEVLLIDTTHVQWAREYSSKKEESTNGNFTSIESSLVAAHGNGKSLAYSDSYISLRDPRLFRSLLRIKLVKFLHVEISSIGGHKGVTPRVNGTTCSYNELQVPLTISLQKTSGNLYMDDIISTFKDNSDETIGANGGDVVDIDIAPAAIMWMWPCPPIPTNSSWVHCYISIQDETPAELHVEGYTTSTSNTRQETRITLPSFVHERTKTLHLHDSLSITSIPGGAPAGIVELDWDELVWCRLERCPSLEGSVFAAPSIRENQKDIFKCLETFWASQLQNARYIWHWGTSFIQPGEDSFKNLTFLHLEHCPRLVHVLPLYISNDSGCCNLETLEIVCCGELREVFPSDPKVQQQKPRGFSRLKRIHLYELPMLQHIYKHHMLARNLETVKIRVCWSLKRLPAVRRPTRRRHRLSTHLGDEAELLDSMVSLDGFESDEEEAQTLPTLDREEDWWNGLEWSGEEFGHHPSHYKPCHSTYHKRTLLRVSVLR